MAEASLIRSWKGEAAVFVEENRAGIVVVTVAGGRQTLPKSDWDQLCNWEGIPPKSFDKPQAAAKT